MKRLIIILALLAVVTAASAADWIEDVGDATVWQVSVTLSGVTTSNKDRMEQLRAFHNFQYRYSGDVLDASDWVKGLAGGIEATQLQGEAPTAPLVLVYRDRLWRTFVTALHTSFPGWLVSPVADKNVNGENASIPTPPAAP